MICPLAPSISEIDARRAFAREKLGGGFDAHATKVESVGIPATLDGGIRTDAAIAMMADGICQLREGFGAKFKEPPLQGARVFGTALAMFGVTPFILSLTIVQECEQLNHEEVSSARSCDAQGVMPYAPPVMGAVVTRPTKRETASDLREQPDSVEHSEIGCPGVNRHAALQQNRIAHAKPR